MLGIWLNKNSSRNYNWEFKRDNSLTIFPVYPTTGDRLRYTYQIETTKEKQILILQTSQSEIQTRNFFDIINISQKRIALNRFKQMRLNSTTNQWQDWKTDSVAIIDLERLEPGSGN